jgi:hypothetical protein
MVKLEDRKVELEKEFNALEDERKKLVEDGKKLNQRLSEIRAKQLQLQGSFAEVDRLLKEDEPKNAEADSKVEESTEEEVKE